MAFKLKNIFSQLKKGQKERGMFSERGKAERKEMRKTGESKFQFDVRKRREREEEDRLRREEVEAARAAAEKNLEGGAASPMKKVIMAPVRKVQNTMRGLLDIVLGFMGWLFGGAILNSLLDMWNGIREGDWDLMKKASTALKGVLATLSAGLTGLNSIWKLITKGIGKAITSVGNFIKNIARGLVNKITGGKGLFGELNLFQ